jgi:hypothetical protein
VSALWSYDSSRRHGVVLNDFLCVYDRDCTFGSVRFLGSGKGVARITIASTRILGPVLRRVSLNMREAHTPVNEVKMHYAIVALVQLKASRTKAKPTTSSEPYPDQDLEYLTKVVAALKDHQEPLSLGDMRRIYNFQPVKLLEVCHRHLELFTLKEGSQGNRIQHPTTFIALRKVDIVADNRIQPESVDQKIAGIIEAASWSGISVGKIWSRHKIQSKVSEDYALRHPDLVNIEERTDREGKTRKFLVWKAAIKPVAVPETVLGASSSARASNTSAAEQSTPETPPKHAPSPELALHKDELLHLLSSGARGSTWLEEHRGITMQDIRCVAAEFPEIRFRIEKRYDSPLSDYSISLAPPEPEPEIVAVTPQPPSFESPEDHMSAEDKSRMRFRPPSPGMGNRRIRQGNNAGIHRDRHPLVSFSP